MFFVDKSAEFCTSFFMEISTRLAFSLPRAPLGHLSNGQEFIFALLSENERVLRDNVQLKKSLEQMAEERDFWKSRCQELESRLNTNSTNSNRPPSTDPPFVRQAESGTTSEVTENTEDQERPKKRPYHRGASQPQLTPTYVQNCEPQVCPTVEELTLKILRNAPGFSTSRSLSLFL